jgi:arginyl-tRNA synthetase
MEQLTDSINRFVHQLYDTEAKVKLSRTEAQFGDYATNVALQLAPQLYKPPLQIAEEIAAKLRELPELAEVSVAGPGFINMKLSDSRMVAELRAAAEQGDSYGKNHSLRGQKVVAEYSDPNPFKVLHAGHLYTSIIGDAIANLLEAAGATVHRVNFGGDVGLHVAKNMWAIIRHFEGEYPEKLFSVAELERAGWLSQRYVEGNAAFESDEHAQQEIATINKRLYDIVEANDKDTPLARIYWMTRQWSYDYFDHFYARIGSNFEKYYPESQTAPLGLKTVREQLSRGVFEESQGAVVFKGEPYGLHTRVFINYQGLPTYETKDVGLIMTKWSDYHFDKSIVITGNDIVEYMKVVLKAVEQFEPHLARATVHLTHGMVKLIGGEKMSSRKGNVLLADEILDATSNALSQSGNVVDDQVVLGAVKHAFLKHRLGGDIVYDPKESVSLHGNSGPYLQYALVRAKAIVRKADGNLAEFGEDLQPDERAMIRKISEYPEVINIATTELMPHFISVYLYELAQTFNQFYEKNRVLGDEREVLRLAIVRAYAGVLAGGLSLLGMPTPDKM